MIIIVIKIVFMCMFKVFIFRQSIAFPSACCQIIYVCVCLQAWHCYSLLAHVIIFIFFAMLQGFLIHNRELVSHLPCCKLDLHANTSIQRLRFLGYSYQQPTKCVVYYIHSVSRLIILCVGTTHILDFKFEMLCSFAC